jgi:hypothetical protein
MEIIKDLITQFTPHHTKLVGYWQEQAIKNCDFAYWVGPAKDFILE